MLRSKRLAAKIGAAALCAVVAAGTCCVGAAWAGLNKVPEGATYEAGGDCSVCHSTETDATIGLMAISAHASFTCTTCHADSTDEAAEDDGAAATGTDKDAQADSGATTDAAAADKTETGTATAATDSSAKSEADETEEVQPTLDEVHADMKKGAIIPSRLKQTSASTEMCLACHTSYEALAELTQDCTALTDSNGTTVNPHEAVTLNEDHAAVMDCFSCHKAHSDKDVDETAADYCMSCHHMKVYECGTCHD